jgi:hypothetical protein
VAVRPGFEGAVLHFLETQEPFGGGTIDFTSEEYLPVAELIREVTDFAGSDEEVYGDSWEIRLPTSLVTVRKDEGLPEWGGMRDEAEESPTSEGARTDTEPALAEARGGG